MEEYSITLVSIVCLSKFRLTCNSTSKLLWCNYNYNVEEISLPIKGHVDVVFTSHELNLIRIETCKCEHAYLLENVSPISWCSWTIMTTIQFLVNLLETLNIGSGRLREPHRAYTWWVKFRHSYSIQYWPNCSTYWSIICKTQLTTLIHTATAKLQIQTEFTPGIDMIPSSGLRRNKMSSWMLNVPLCPERNVTPMECTPCAPRVITKSTWSGQGDLTTSLQCVIKLMSHADDAICHCFQLYCPICKKIPVPKSKKLIKDATSSPLPGTTNGIKK